MVDLFSDVPTPRHGIRTGMGGWTFVPWRDNFYPRGLVQRRELEFASRQVAAIEINGTFYGPQKPATFARWRDETPAGFVFSVKAPKQIVQSRRLAATASRIDAFIRGGIAELGDRLGPVLWQLAPPRAFDHDDLAGFLDLLPRELDGVALRHVLEVRNPGFMCAQYLALARAHGVATVFTDSPEYPSFADVTGDFVYARLMRSRADVATGYPAAELDAWAARARCWAAGGDPDDLPRIEPAAATSTSPREVFVFFISAAKERNPAAAMALHARL